ncbi:hypothetical protein CERZMDRAFT_96411 [Cercospora zeae-maydis SCOH1-5]|uniref:Uncharacterized protein n=1 Tax=Cercospora zeae-maydis SCOH1-5 TaxID=717836 RepID=A0A6A6FJD1_9PEZI|nr:hypothetical protein CERZMDRAFT_96411 [Cercospora zeae-maydis SCOH1-5]
MSDVAYVSGLPANESHIMAIKRRLRGKRPNLKIAGTKIQIPIKSHEVLMWTVTTWVRLIDEEAYTLALDIDVRGNSATLRERQLASSSRIQYGRVQPSRPRRVRLKGSE